MEKVEYAASVVSFRLHCCYQVLQDWEYEEVILETLVYVREGCVGFTHHLWYGMVFNEYF